MIIARAPLRISFVGGGTDLPAFYTKSPGRVLSAAINKYVYVSATRTPFNTVAVRYSTGESVSHPRELKNDRVREALIDFGIERNIEISTFSHLPGKTGLGSSSAFSVALMKALGTFQGRRLDASACAEGACRLELDLLKEPIGKQDQYASAFGGINVLEFNSDGAVGVEPLALDFKLRLDFERHLLLFFTGIVRDASSILSEQRENTSEHAHTETLKAMAQSVDAFKDALLRGNFETLGRMLHDGWERKRTLASGVSNTILDELYAIGRSRGAQGGKVLGAGGGGCILFLVEPKNRETLSRVLLVAAKRHGLVDAAVVPFSFTHSGVEIVVDNV